MKLSSFLYPLRCPVCDQPVDVFMPRICPDCRKKISYCTEPCCLKCGTGLSTDRQMYCAGCSRSQRAFLQGRGTWFYEGAARESVMRFKTANRRTYASFYAQEMLRMQGEWILSRRAQVFIPVPLTKKKKRRRGYNQAALLARELSLRTDIPVLEDLLLRQEGSRQQKELSGQMRRMNLQHVFYVNQKYISGSDGPAEKIPPHTVILIDDIYTTGSTVDAASRVLLDAGVQAVYAAYLCVGES